MEEKDYRELYDLKKKLHKLMKDIILTSSCGSIEEEGIEDSGPESLNLDFAGGELYSCLYYEQVRFSDNQGEEHEFDDDLNKIRGIFKELEARWKEITTLKNEKEVNDILNRNFKV